MKQGPKVSPNYMYTKQNLGITNMKKITLRYTIMKLISTSESSQSHRHVPHRNMDKDDSMLL